MRGVTVGSMRRAQTRWALLAGVTSLVALTPAAAVAEPPSRHVKAIFTADDIATADPCVVGFALVSVTDFVAVDQPSPDNMNWEFVLYDKCTPGSRPRYVYQGAAFQAVAESAFTVGPSMGSADLNVTVPGFDFIARVTEPVTLDLRWETAPGAARDLAVVTGTLTSPRVTLELDDSIVWSEWHTGEVPASGLWLCPSESKPGCIGRLS